MSTKTIATPTALLPSGIGALTRRGLLGGMAAGLTMPALAQFRVEIAGVGATRLPIAISDFNNEAAPGQPLAASLRADLERSGQFSIVPGQSGMW